MLNIIYSEKFGSECPSPVLNPRFESFESPKRVLAAYLYFHKRNFFKRKDVTIIPPHPLEEEDLLRVHTNHLIQKVKNLSNHGTGKIGRLVKATPGIYELAKLSAGAVTQLLVKLVEVGKEADGRDEDNGPKRADGADNDGRIHGSSNEPRIGLSINRPPGHHAFAGKSDGLCVFNNIAIAIRYIQQVKGFRGKIAIIDIDAHFGNGTSSIFYEDPDVLYISLHEGNLTGSMGLNQEIGENEGGGKNVNIRIPFQANGEIWFKALNIPREILLQFQPDLIIVASGLDGHYSDPIGNLQLTCDDYRSFGTWLSSLQRKLGGPPVGFVLEGGYSTLILGQAM